MRNVGFRFLLVALVVPFLGHSADAQDFSKTVFFGDSNTDSGWFIRQQPNNIPAGFSWPLPADAQGSPSGRPVWSEQIATYLGQSAIPANAPGGTNYAAAGARATQDFTDTPSLRSQVTNFLAAGGGKADPNAVYFFWEGVNDVRAILAANGNVLNNAARASIALAAAAQAADIARLQAAGAKYIVVVPAAFGNNAFPNNTAPAARNVFTQNLVQNLDAAGVNYIPADFRSVNSEIFGFPERFGITNTTGQACGEPFPNGIYCRPSDLVSPDAQQTYTTVDDVGHQTAVVNKIFADYVHSLLAAPSQIGMLAEAAVKSRAGSGLVGTIQDQIGFSLRNRGPKGGNAWVQGDVSWLDLDNHPGFGDASGTPVMVAIGADFHVAPGLIVGGAFSVGGGRIEFGHRADGADLGDFSQREFTASLYAAAKLNGFTADVIGTWGTLDYDINRGVPMGFRVASLSGATEGTNWSLAASAGYDFTLGRLTHGPMVGITAQRVRIDGFNETASDASWGYLALGFGDQSRDSIVGSLGWRLSYDADMFQPFAKISLKHEFEADDRIVTATVLSASNANLVGLSYGLPVASLGQDWATVTVGTEVRLGNGISGVVSGTGSFGQDDVSKYGVQAGLRVAY